MNRHSFSEHWKKYFQVKITTTDFMIFNGFLEILLHHVLEFHNEKVLFKYIATKQVLT